MVNLRNVNGKNCHVIPLSFSNYTSMNNSSNFIIFLLSESHQR